MKIRINRSEITEWALMLSMILPLLFAICLVTQSFTDALIATGLGAISLICVWAVVDFIEAFWAAYRLGRSDARPSCPIRERQTDHRVHDT